MIFRKVNCSAILLICFLSVNGLALAKDINNKKLLFWSNYRLRYEYQDNFNIKSYGHLPIIGEANDGFWIGRIRAGFRYNVSENLLISLGIQHAVVWDLAIDDEDFYNGKFKREHNPYKDYFEPFDTFVEIKNIYEKLNIKAGRQQITYGDKRIFGPGNWGNSGKWLWDAIRISYRFDNSFCDVYYGKTVIHDPDVLSIVHRYGYSSLGFYGSFLLPVNFFDLRVEPFSMTKEDNHDLYKGEDGKFGNLKTYYIGARMLIEHPQGFYFDLTYVSQKGDYADDNIDAYGYHILLGYRNKDILLEPSVSVEYSYASGDNNPNDSIRKTFDAAFGARDSMYGRMNLFQWMNLKDLQYNVEIKPKDNIYAKFEFHKFCLAEEKDAWYLNSKVYRDKSGNSGDKVGKEFDVVVKIDLPHNNEIQIGYGHFWPDKFAKKVASNDDANWIFVQWRFKFSKWIY